jgi:hypothetical protein
MLGVRRTRPIFPGTSFSRTAFRGTDVEIHHLEKAQPLRFSNVKVVASGPLRAAVETEAKYGSSTIKVTVSGARDLLLYLLIAKSDLVGCRGGYYFLLYM